MHWKPSSWNPAKWNRKDWLTAGGSTAAGVPVNLLSEGIGIAGTMGLYNKYFGKKSYADPLDKTKILAQQRQAAISQYENLMGQQRSLMSSGDYSNPAMTQYLLGKQSALGMQNTLTEVEKQAAQTGLDIDKYNQEYKESRRKEDTQKRTDFLSNLAKTAAAAAATYFSGGTAAPLLAGQLASWGASAANQRNMPSVTDRYTLDPDQVTNMSSYAQQPMDRLSLGVGTGQYDDSTLNGGDLPDYLKQPYDGKYGGLSDYGIQPLQDVQYSDKNMKTAEAPDPQEIEDFLQSLGGGRKYKWKPGTPDYDGGQSHIGTYTQDLQKSDMGRSTLKKGRLGTQVDIGQLSTALAAGLGHLYEKVTDLEHKRNG